MYPSHDNGPETGKNSKGIAQFDPRIIQNPNPHHSLRISKHPVSPQDSLALLRSGWPALVHPAEPAAAVGLVLRRRLVLGFLDQSQWSHLAAHHDRSATASARLAVAAAGNAAWRRAWVAGLSGLVARIRRRVGHGAQAVDIGRRCWAGSIGCFEGRGAGCDFCDGWDSIARSNTAGQLASK